MLVLALAAAAAAANTPVLRSGLEPLGFLVGHCWRGRFASGEQDTHCFDAAYGGQHVRDRHEVTGGAQLYSGETLYSVDGGAVSYTYWNSIGGVSRGSMRPRGDGLDFGTETYRGPNGRQAAITTAWRRAGDNAYEAMTSSPEMPSMSRTVRYERVAEAVSVSSSTAPDGRTTLVHETIVAAPAARVWEAISTAQGWAGWAVPVAWLDGDLLETSYSATAARGDPTTIQQRIVATVPGRLIVFRTVKAPEGFPNFETFRAVTHMIEIEPVGESRTRVRLTSAGYADDDAGRQLAGFFRDGNRVSLERLRQRFLTGPIAWSEVAEGGR